LRVDGWCGLAGCAQLWGTYGLCAASSLAAGARTVEALADQRLGEMKLKLDLHDIYNRGGDIDRALQDIIDEAVRKRAPLVEIIPGKGSGQLKKHVLRFLDRKDIKALYHRVEKDSKNFGRLFVHFRWK
jgi:DNA-nicking Smr family endonuclease